MSPGRGDGDFDVSTFGESLTELSEEELERRAEAYLSEVESRHKEAAEAYLGFSESWDTSPGRGDGDRLEELLSEVDRGDD